MQFRIPYQLPIAQKHIAYSEITNAMSSVIIKYIATDNNDLIAGMFDDLIAETTGETPHEMFVLDKFFLLLEMRSVAMGDKIELQAQHARATITLSTILNGLTNKITNIAFEHTFNVDDILISTHMPKKFVTSDIGSLLNCCIHQIKHKDEVYDFHAMTTQEQNDFVNSLPADATNKIIEHIKINKSYLADINIINPNTQVGLDAFPLDVYDGSLLVFAKSIYREDLMQFYEMHYNIIKKLELTNDHFMSMTPNECRIFVNLHNKDAKKQQEEQSKQQQASSRFSTLTH